ncbi:MAG: alpha/beta hydrolase fold domain-containing protein [Gammaproteobacteria bacterium]|nr:alpha/beta hydrolase fold domain-containing protein [Gammaproteobacteria bacterium]
MFRRDEMLAFRSRLFGDEMSRLRGEWDPEARAAWEAATAFMSSEAFPEITEANVPRLREMTKPERTPADLAAMAACQTTVFACDGRRFGSPDNARIEIRVHVPAGTGPRKGIVFCHGGAFVLGSAADEDPWACRTAAECNLVVFNVDYRNAPETRAPGGILDCYAALRCVAAELCTRYGVEPDRIGVYGISSGGYLAAAVAMELARRREAHLVRMVIADVPAVSDHWVRTPPASPHAGAWHWSQSEVERWHGTHGHIETLAMLAEDWERQVRERDPYLFPATMGDELLRRVPNHVVMTREFDFLRTDAELYASDLARHGKLLDFYVRPGVSHYTGPETGVLRRIVDAYL